VVLLGQAGAPLHKQVKVMPLSDHIKPKNVAIVNQHPPAHRPLDACSYSVVDEPQLGLVYGFTLVTNYVRNRFYI
jgi:hypothetical protein